MGPCSAFVAGEKVSVAEFASRCCSCAALKLKSLVLAYNQLHKAITAARMCRARKEVVVAKLVFGMNQSLDGYVDHVAFAPGPTLFRHFIEEAHGKAGSVYGRQMYEVMRYWGDDCPEWDADEHAFAAAWRKQPKWPGVAGC